MRLQFSRHRLQLFCGLICFALLASTGMAQQRSGRSVNPGGAAEGRLMKRNGKAIGLSEETVAKIDAAIEASTARETDLREESKDAFDKLTEVLLQNLPSEKELMAASDKVGDYASKSRQYKMKSIIEMRSLLTPEQLEKFMEFRKKAAPRR